MAKLEPNPTLRCRKRNPDEPHHWCGRKRKHKGKCVAYDMGGDVLSVYVGEC